MLAYLGGLRRTQKKPQNRLKKVLFKGENERKQDKIHKQDQFFIQLPSKNVKLGVYVHMRTLGADLAPRGALKLPLGAITWVFRVVQTCLNILKLYKLLFLGPMQWLNNRTKGIGPYRYVRRTWGPPKQPQNEQTFQGRNKKKNKTYRYLFGGCQNIKL